MSVRVSAGAGAILLAAALSTSCSSTTGGAPVAQHSAAPAPASIPTSSVAAQPPTAISDEDQVRETVMAFQDAANSQNWDAYLDLMCAPMRAKFTGTVMDYLKKDRTRTGATTVTITSVSITGDTATVQLNSHNEAVGSRSVSMRLKREVDGWKMCQTYP